MEARRALIDTSVFIEHLRARAKSDTALARLSRSGFFLVTSTIVAAELYYGARSRRLREDVNETLSEVGVLSLSLDVARRISEEAEKLKRRNAMVGFRDLAIACVALENALPVATLNKREFQRVSGLQLLELSPLA